MSVTGADVGRRVTWTVGVTRYEGELRQVPEIGSKRHIDMGGKVLVWVEPSEDDDKYKGAPVSGWYWLRRTEISVIEEPNHMEEA